MKTANVSQLHHKLGSVLEWIAEGQQVEIVKHGKVLARLSPPSPPSAKPKPFKLPDFAVRRKRIFGTRVRWPRGWWVVSPHTTTGRAWDCAAFAYAAARAAACWQLKRDVAGVCDLLEGCEEVAATCQPGRVEV